MPDEKLSQETDRDAQSLFEDTAAHERTGFRVNDSMPLDDDPPKDKIKDRYDLAKG